MLLSILLGKLLMSIHLKHLPSGPSLFRLSHCCFGLKFIMEISWLFFICRGWDGVKQRKWRHSGRMNNATCPSVGFSCCCQGEVVCGTRPLVSCRHSWAYSSNRALYKKYLYEGCGIKLILLHFHGHTFYCANGIGTQATKV